MIITKDIDNKVFDYIDTWYGTLSSIAQTIRSPYNHTIWVTPPQSVFGRDKKINLASVVDWRVITSRNQ